VRNCEANTWPCTLTEILRDKVWFVPLKVPLKQLARTASPNLFCSLNATLCRGIVSEHGVHVELRVKIFDRTRKVFILISFSIRTMRNESPAKCFQHKVGSNHVGSMNVDSEWWI
jgi:hypothetical protein